jgi:uncharacterized beta-barrel protein YwiB (DUF1934 family)
MSKSIKRNNKYFGYDEYEDAHHEDHTLKLKEKRIRSVLRSSNKNAILDLIEEDY